MTRRKPLSLYELNQLIRSVIDTALSDTFLVTAEIASLTVKNHCYLSLVDKDDDTVRAEMSAVIWANRYKTVKADFSAATGIELAKGIKILFEASVTFHERYGIKLNILDIDPSYTIGELALKRKAILERLTKEGLIDKNRKLEFPLVPQRIGIISSSSAAGYEDMMTHLINNTYGYKFDCRLYEATMQGDRAEASIVSALKQCARDASGLDIAVIVRGGGGRADLICFDSYEIAKAIANMPLPVISGIGHERDITVCDETANTRAKTPTAAAGILITAIKDYEDRLDSSARELVHGINRAASGLKEGLASLTKTFENSVRNELVNSYHALSTLMTGLSYAGKLIKIEKDQLRSRESNINHLNPLNVLKRGFSITYNNGKAIKSASEIKSGDRLQTVLYAGEINSSVESIKKTGRHNEKKSEL
ncbi:MAG TPA: exodeoxyribonuclease VII large subunit [Nitrospirae bacterium]|nr:exodeoxyribonuclease VII large subunit [Nitrospirota bacterium]